MIAVPDAVKHRYQELLSCRLASCRRFPRVRVLWRNLDHGAWLVFDPSGAQQSSGAFLLILRVGVNNFTDGLSNTIGFSEVKAISAELERGNRFGISAHGGGRR